jgi:Tfp pilus assembly protein PilF
MRWRVTLICALAFTLALPLPPARATLQQDYLEIYLKLNDSERLERNGDFKGALEGFQDCYEKLRKIHTHNPDWETVLVTSRMEDCRAKINELEPKVDSTVNLPPPAAVPVSPEGTVITPVTPATGTTGATPLGDEATLRARLADVEQQLATTKQELADTQEKYKNSQLEVQTLHQQIDTVNQQLAALKNAGTGSVDENMGKLLSENKELTDKLTSARAQIKALTSNPKSAVAKLSAQLKAVQDKLDASEAANSGLMETTSTLQAQLTQAQADLAAANQKLAGTAVGSPEYLTLKRENEVMRGILLREIQEQSRRDGAKRLAQEEFDRLKINSKVLQEQLDILGSPMTPPTSDQERMLIDSLKVTPAEPTPLVDAGTGNSFTATTNAAPTAPATDTNMAAATPTPTPAATDTNMAAATPTPTPAATDTNMASTATPPIAPPADTNSVIVVPTETNAAPAVASATNAPAATETNTAPATNMAAATPTPTPAAATETNTASAPATNAAPMTNATPVAVDTNMPASTPAAPATTNTASATPDTNAPAGTAVADNTMTSTTTSSADTSAAAAAPADSDPTRYSNKPRLPADMHDIAQQASDLFKMQRYDDAAAKYQQIIDKYPDSLYAWSNLGVVRSQEGKLPDAMKALQQAVKLSPNDAFSYRNLGIVYYQLNQNDAAIDALERSIALEPNNVYSHDYLGCACSQKGWQEVAEKEFRKAIEIDDNFPDAHYNLAIVYAMQKPPSLELARRHYKRALELGIPKDPRLEKLLGLQ